MEKRRHQRLQIENLAVDASDGVGFLQGSVADASRCGVCVSDLQRRKGGDPARMTFVIHGRGKNFKITVRPKWSVTQGAGKTVGAEILDPPGLWTQFVMSFET